MKLLLIEVLQPSTQTIHSHPKTTKKKIMHEMDEKRNKPAT